MTDNIWPIQMIKECVTHSCNLCSCSTVNKGFCRGLKYNPENRDITIILDYDILSDKLREELDAADKH